MPTLPPPDVAAVYVFAGGEQHGPMSRRDLFAQLDAGRFAADDLFWYADVDGWTRLGDHPELFDDVRPVAPAPAPAPAPAVEPAPEPAASAAVDPALLRTTALSTAELQRAAQGLGAESGPQAAADGAVSVQPQAAVDDGSSMATIQMTPESVAQAVASQAMASQTVASQAVASQAGASQAAPAQASQPYAAAQVAASLSTAPSAGFSEHAAGSAADEELDGVFVDLVESSWEWVTENRFASHIDEVFLGALITGTLDAGFSLIDLSSDGSHHYLRFESLEGAGGVTQGSRLIVRMRHLTGDLARAKVLGQRASVVIGYGEKAPNAKQVIEALKAELKSGFLQDSEPGTITVDGDLTSGYVYAQIDLHWRLDEYVHDDYRIESSLITRHVSACAHALRKYLRGRFS
ncbi:MAG: DUF4339 domain-containing protein [Acidobacteriota bacterium]